jgi:hypothetical protein
MVATVKHVANDAYNFYDRGLLVVLARFRLLTGHFLACHHEFGAPIMFAGLVPKSLLSETSKLTFEYNR